MLWRGGYDGGDHRRERIRRVEYAAVNMVASVNTIKIRRFIGLNISISRIRSLE